MDSLSSATSAKRRLITGITLAVLGAAVCAIIVGRSFSGGDGQRETNVSPDTKKMLEELRAVTPHDLRRLSPKAARTTGETQSQQSSREESPAASPEIVSRPLAAKSTSASRRENYRKDLDIIEQYKELSPTVAATDSLSTGEESALRYRPRPFSAGGESEVKGGVRVVGRTRGADTAETVLSLHDTTIRARLKFSIRSSASNTIVAETTTDVPGVPAGSLFYGTGSFANKRTYVQFTKVRIGTAEYPVKAYAISGKDPGIPSEVIEIENNAKITFTSGVTDAAGKVIDNLAATASSGVTSGIISGTAGEVKNKNEQERARYEYRVGAGTIFNVYVE